MGFRVISFMVYLVIRVLFLTFAAANIAKDVESRNTYARDCCLIGPVFVCEAAPEARQQVRQHAYWRQQSHARPWHPLRAEHGCLRAQGEKDPRQGKVASVVLENRQ